MMLTTSTRNPKVACPPTMSSTNILPVKEPISPGWLVTLRVPFWKTMTPSHIESMV